MGSLPLVLPGIMAAVVVAIMVSPPLARYLRTQRLIVALIIVSAGTILAVTLSPNLAGLAAEAEPGRCDLARMGLPSVATLRSDSDATRNIILFIPLGLGLGLLPWSRRAAAVIGAAFLLTVFVELTQLLVLPLERGCESADMVDNTIGLVVGLAMGSMLKLAGGRRRPGRD